MVPWRATEEGFVTREVLDWYERFARGQPGAIVVEATGIRDIPSGPLLRIGHDRFVPGLRELVETVRVASEGQSRLFIQVIDFLSVKRRPPAEKFFQRFLEIRPGHREKLSEVLEDPRWKAVSTWRVHHIGIISTISLNRADDVDGSRSSALSSSPWRTQLETDVRD